MFRLLGQGWKLLKNHKKAVVYFYLTNLLVAALLLFPFMEIFEDSLGPGLYREKLLPALDYDWYTLFQDRVTGFASSFAPWVMGAGPFAKNLETLLDGKLTDFPWEIVTLGGLYVVLNSFLLAAAVGSFALDPKGTSVREFFRTGGMFFGRFFRLAILALLAFWLVDSWIVEPLTDWVKQLADEALTDRGAFYWNFGRYLLLLVIFLVLNMLFDYAKVKTAVEDRTSMVLALFSAMNFCTSYFFSAFGFYLLIVLLGVSGVVVYTGVEHFFPQQTWLAVLLALVWQQLYMIGRMIIKLLFYSSQMQFYLQREGALPPLSFTDS